MLYTAELIPKDRTIMSAIHCMRVGSGRVVLGREGVCSGEKWATRARGDGIIAVVLVSLLLAVWRDNTGYLYIQLTVSPYVLDILFYTYI